MTKHKQIYLSLSFLFIFLASFSTNTYISLHNSVKSFYHFSKNKELQSSVPVSATEDLVFEETENDSEESFEALPTLLPSFLSFLFQHKTASGENARFSFTEELSTPLYISIRVLRI